MTNIEQDLDRYAPKASAEVDLAPSYRVIGDTKIPVSKNLGKVLQGKKDAAVKYRAPFEASWQEAIRYYNNDQSAHRGADALDSLGARSRGTSAMSGRHSETENLVFANTTTLLPAIYAKNPTVECTAYNRDNEQYATVCERLLQNLMTLKSHPGVNIKPKVRKAALSTLLTNEGWLEIGWQFKEASSDQALIELQEISDALAQRDLDTREINKLYGRLEALEKHLDVLQPEGLMVKYRRTEDVYVDPECEENDLSDARYVVVKDYISTSYLNARYGDTDPESQQVKSVYEPTHILPAGNTNSADDLVANFSLFSGDYATNNYGHGSQDSYLNAQRTLVWYYWDKTTRRVFMFSDKDWSWPIWVWNDPLRLLNFYPFYNLAFYTSPTSRYMKGEVGYYLDQQDAINDIHSEKKLTRGWLRRNIFYNPNVVDKEDVMAVLNGPDGTARPLNVPADTDLNKIITTVAPPSFQIDQFFTTEYDRLRATIDGLCSVGAVQRGVEFKTNTTNKAIEAYNSASQTRLDEKIDMIEDFIGDVAWGMLQLCVQFMSADTVAQIVGPQLAMTTQWRNMDPTELQSTLAMKVIGGSSAKPTSLAKRQEALELAQVLGQFASASPAIVMIILRMFEESFDGIVVQDEDWELIKQTMIAAQQKAGAGPDGQQPPVQGEVPPAAPADGASMDGVMQQILGQGGPAPMGAMQ